MNIPFKDISILSTEQLKALRACDVIDSLIISFSKTQTYYFTELSETKSKTKKIHELYSLTAFSFARSTKHRDGQMFYTEFCIYKMYRHDDTE